MLNSWGSLSVKYSFSSITNHWKKGGAGGWDALLQSRLPTPIRLNPNDGVEALEKIVKDLVFKLPSCVNPSF